MNVSILVPAHNESRNIHQVLASLLAQTTDRPHIIERLAPGIAMQTPDVDSFVESGVDQTLRRRYRVADKSVTAAFRHISATEGGHK